MKGFQRIGSLANRIKKMGLALEDGSLLGEILRSNEDYILDLNRRQLNDQGINSQGISIASYAPYTASTIARKIRKGQPYDRVTLRDTGKFQAGFSLEVGKNIFRISSRDQKTPQLIDKYGPYIFGLTNESKDQLVSDVVIPAIFDAISKTIDDE
ncbi:MAG: hypothetical protein IKX02_01975 [Spirochaetales bacterium]|nr:hypothetical protein [Spirochaetales bacterium]